MQKIRVEMGVAPCILNILLILLVSTAPFLVAAESASCGGQKGYYRLEGEDVSPSGQNRDGVLATIPNATFLEVNCVEIKDSTFRGKVALKFNVSAYSALESIQITNSTFTDKFELWFFGDATENGGRVSKISINISQSTFNHQALLIFDQIFLDGGDDVTISNNEFSLDGMFSLPLAGMNHSDSTGRSLALPATLQTSLLSQKFLPGLDGQESNYTWGGSILFAPVTFSSALASAQMNIIGNAFYSNLSFSGYDATTASTVGADVPVVSFLLGNFLSDFKEMASSGALQILDNSFTVHCYDRTMVSAVYIPPLPGRTSHGELNGGSKLRDAAFSVAQTTISGNNFTMRILGDFQQSSFVSLPANRATVSRYFILFGYRPESSGEETVSVTGTPGWNSSFLLTGAHSSFTFQRNNISVAPVSAATGEMQSVGYGDMPPDNLLLWQSRFYVFYYDSSPMTLYNHSRFSFSENTVKAASLCETTTFKLNSDVEDVARSLPSIVLYNNSQMKFSKNLVVNFAKTGVRSTGFSGFFLSQVVQTWGKQLLFHKQGSLVFEDNQLFMWMQGLLLWGRSPGSMIAIFRGTVNLTEGSSLLSSGSTINATAADGPGGLQVPGACTELDCWPFVPYGRPNAEAYSIHAQTVISGNSIVNFSDARVEMANGHSLRCATVGPAVGDESRFNRREILTYRVLQLTSSSTFEISPKLVSLLSDSATQGIHCSAGYFIVTLNSKVHFGRGPAEWTLISYYDKGSINGAWVSEDAMYEFTFNTQLDAFCRGTNISVSATFSVRPIYLTLRGVPIHMSSHIGYLSSWRLFATNVDEVDDGIIVRYRAQIQATNNYLIPIRLVDVDNQFFLSYSNLTALVGLDAKFISDVPGSGLCVNSDLALTDRSFFSIGDLNIENTAPFTTTVAKPAVVLFEHAVTLKHGSMFSLTSTNSTGMLLLYCDIAYQYTPTLIVEDRSMIAIMNNLYRPTQGTPSKEAAVLMGIPMRITENSQLLILSNKVTGGGALFSQVADTAAIYLYRKISLSVNSEILSNPDLGARIVVTSLSSIHIAQNLVSGPAFVQDGGILELTLSNYSYFTVANNIFTSGRTDPILVQRASSLDEPGTSFSAPPQYNFTKDRMIIRCNRFFTSDKTVQSFDDAVLTSGTAWDAFKPLHQIGCDDTCYLDEQQGDPTSDGMLRTDRSLQSSIAYCSPMGLPPLELIATPQGAAGQRRLNLTVNNFTAVEIEPAEFPHGNILATSEYVNSTIGCICSRCTSALQLRTTSIAGGGQFSDSPYRGVLQAPLCQYAVPIPWEPLGQSFRFPTKPPSRADEFAVWISPVAAGTGLLVVIIIVACCCCGRRLQTQRKEIKELHEALIAAPTLHGAALTEWKAKPTALTFRKGKQIGSGGFGNVFVGFDDSSGRLLAAKEINLHELPDRERTINLLKMEVRVMKKLSNPNVVQYLGADISEEGNFLIFMEFLPGGSLRSLINSYGHLSQKVASQYTKQALSGLVYLHNEGVVHRDIKAGNMLMDRDGILKLADMGCSQNIQSIRSIRGTPFWMAPEVVNNDKGKVSGSSDIWSLGCTVMEMLTGQLPFSWTGANGFAVMRIVADGGKKLDDLWHACPCELRESEPGFSFVRTCCEWNPSDRPSAENLLKHPFLANSDELVASVVASSSRIPSNDISTLGSSTVGGTTGDQFAGITLLGKELDKLASGQRSSSNETTVGGKTNSSNGSGEEMSVLHFEKREIAGGGTLTVGRTGDWARAASRYEPPSAQTLLGQSGELNGSGSVAAGILGGGALGISLLEEENEATEEEIKENQRDRADAFTEMLRKQFQEDLSSEPVNVKLKSNES